MTAELLSDAPVARTPRPVPPAPRWWRDAITGTCWARMTIVASLWITGRGPAGLGGSPAELLTSLGRLTGLVAADLLLLQVLLMARVPVIERSYGQDELARRHRTVGFWSFTLLVAHIVLITIGYTLADHTNVLRETWTLVTTYGGMLLAVAGTAALTLVTVTSIRIARRRLRYESWHLLHLYAYLGVGLTVPHQIWTGADFATSSLARAYWWTSYAAAAGAVLAYRVGLPVWRTLRHRLTVASVVQERPGVVTVHLAGRELDRLPVRAGQFFVFRFLDGPGWSRGNPYSLSAAPRGDRLRLTAKNLGDGSGRLAGLRPGTRVLIEGPYGRLTGAARSKTKVALLACGIGITPMRALLEDLQYAPGEAVLVYRAGTESDLVFRAELDALARDRGVVVHYVPGHRIPDRASWLPEDAAAWRDDQALLHLIPDLRTVRRVRVRTRRLDGCRPYRGAHRRPAPRPTASGAFRMVTRIDRLAARRNAAVAAATGVALGLLFLVPASLNHVAASPGQVAPTAIVAEAAGDQTVTGPAVDTRFGPVQVQVQVRDGALVAAQAVDYPQNNGRDRQINAYAVPLLNGEAVDAQGADIDTVSGATYTSVGYKESLQAALDSAHLS